ncbi:MAG: hypothetical protein AAGC44_06555 [Planctomycetota bacterium]
MELWIVLGVLAVLVVPVVVPVLQSFAIAGASVHPLDPASTQKAFATSREAVDEDVLLELGFERDGAYLVDLRIGKAVFAMWRRGSESTYAAVYGLGSPDGGKWHLDFVTVLQDQPMLGVTTGDVRDTHTSASMAGWYKQSFGDKTTRAAWGLHNNAEVYICQKHAVDPKGVSMTGGEVLQSWLRRDARYAITHPWRFLIVPWRYWVGRHLRHGKTVEELD